MGASRPVFIWKYQNFSLSVFLSICLIFCKFQPAVAYKSVAYKKACTHVFFKSLVYIIYVEPSRTLNRVFYFSFPNTIKPGK